MSLIVQPSSTNRKIKALQELLNQHGARPPLYIDGVWGARTSQAVHRFQTASNLRVDGKVGPQTWGRLNRPPGASGNSSAPPVSQPDAPSTTGSGDFCFPLAARPSPDWKSGARYFGARRSGGTRLHAGCDLLGPKGTPIYAISDGTLVREPYYFYSGTHAVELRHGSYIIRYGEILPGSYVGGRTVRKGQLICRIGRLNSGSSMLHFEMYSNGRSTARLTTGTGPYKRRADVINPSPHLDAWLSNMPG